MKLNRLFATAIISLAALSTAFADDQSLASIFTNVPSRPAAVPRRSSILVLAFRGLAFSDLSCYGQTNFQTPNFDRLAAGGMRFTNYRLPSDDFETDQAALLTGGSNADPQKQTTLAFHMQDADYATGLLGEWGMRQQPWTQGFAEFGGYMSEDEARDYYSNFIWRYLHGSNIREALSENNDGQKQQYIPDLLLFGAGNFAKTHAPDFGNRYKPFFLVVNLHPPASVSRQRDEYPVPTDAPYSSEAWPQAAKNRAALMSRLDVDLGRLLDQFQSIHMTNNLAIFITASAPPQKFANTNLNFLQVKGEVRGGDSPDHLRVPMIVYWPEHVPAGQVSDVPWSALDFGPTALDIAYAKPVQSFAGRSMLPALLGANGTNAAAPLRQ